MKWVICNDQPFSVVESKELRRLFCILNNGVLTPTADTIREDVMKAFGTELTRIQEILQVSLYSSKLTLFISDN